MISIQEVNFYNSLAERNLVGKINCPFGADDIVVTKVNDQDEVYFKCLTCDTIFHPGVKVINIIKDTIDKYKNQV
jgi:hypothetical protein